MTIKEETEMQMRGLLSSASTEETEMILSNLGDVEVDDLMAEAVAGIGKYERILSQIASHFKVAVQIQHANGTTTVTV